MILRHSRLRQRGFTLVEILVVLVILGLALVAMYGVFESNRRSAYKQEDIVEVQQNLRIAMSQVGRDIMLSGFMLPAGQAIATAGQNSLTLQTASQRGVGVRIDVAAPFDSPSDPSTDVTIQVASAEMTDMLQAGDYVRIIRPGDFGQPVDQVLRVQGVSRATPSVTVRGFNTSGTYRKGFMLVRVIDANADGDGNPNTNPPAHPNAVTYSLQDDPDSADPAMLQLRRAATGEAGQVVAHNVTALVFSYLLEDGTEVASLPAGDARLAEILAVRVTLSGSLDATRAGTSGVVNRALTNVISLRNR